MKGLSKGLKYISQFFENEKEQEIQIGAPTDVKHVAHIGNNGPFNNAPSWMNDFQLSSDTMSAAPIRNGENKDDPSSEAPARNGETKDNDSTKSSDKDSLPREIGEMQKSMSVPSDAPTRHNSTKTKQSKRQTSDTTDRNRENSEGTKPRRHKSTNSDPSNRDSSDRPRRNKNSGSGTDFSTQDPNGPTKKNRKKSRSGDSTRSSRSKESSESLNLIENFGNMDLGSEFESKDNKKEPNPDLDNDEGSLCDEISSEIRAL